MQAPLLLFFIFIFFVTFYINFSFIKNIRNSKSFDENFTVGSSRVVERGVEEESAALGPTIEWRKSPGVSPPVCRSVPLAAVGTRSTGAHSAGGRTMLCLGRSVVASVASTASASEPVDWKAPCDVEIDPHGGQHLACVAASVAAGRPVPPEVPTVEAFLDAVFAEADAGPTPALGAAIVYTNGAFGTLAASGLCSLAVQPNQTHVAVAVVGLEPAGCTAVTRVHPAVPCFAPSIGGLDGAQIRGSKVSQKAALWSLDRSSQYAKILSEKVLLLQQMVRRGAARHRRTGSLPTLILLDADTVVLDLPGLLAQLPPSVDVAFTSDSRGAHKPETADWLCAGVMIFRPTAAMTRFLAAVARVMADHSLTDQDAMQLLLTNHTQMNSQPAAYDAADYPFHPFSFTTIPTTVFANGKELDKPRIWHTRPDGQQLVGLHANQRAFPRKAMHLARASLWLLSPSNASCSVTPEVIKRVARA